MSQANSSSDIDGAASRISSLISGRLEPQPEEKNPDTDEHLTEQEPSTDETESDVERYEVKVGDKTEKLTLDELRKGYMMQADYTRKTQEIAEKRREIEQQEATALKRLEETVSDAAKLLQADLDELNSDKFKELKDFDPDTYWKRVEDVHKRADKLKALKEQEQTAIQKKREERLKEETGKLLERIPEWLDDDKKKSEGQKVAQFLEGLGYTDGDDLTDHRLFVMARKAMLFDEIQSQNIEQKKVKQAPKSAKPSTGVEVTDSVRKRREQLRKTGSMRDAQRAIKDLMR